MSNDVRGARWVTGLHALGHLMIHAYSYYDEARHLHARLEQAAADQPVRLQIQVAATEQLAARIRLSLPAGTGLIDFVDPQVTVALFEMPLLVSADRGACGSVWLQLPSELLPRLYLQVDLLPSDGP